MSGIKHVVMLGLAQGGDPAELADVMARLADLIGQIEGFTGFDHGPNLNPVSAAHSYGFVCTFEDEAALHRYEADPKHRALGRRLETLCADGAGILVYDLDTAQGFR